MEVFAWLAAVVVYCLWWVLAFVFEALPGSLIVSPVCCLVGFAAAIARMTTALLDRRAQIEVRGPDSARQAKASASGLPDDSAWQGYFVRQVWIDFGRAAGDCGRIAAAVVRPIDERIGAYLADYLVPLVIILPLLLPVAAGLLAAFLGMLVGLAFCATLLLAATVLVWTVGGLVAGVLRGADLLWQWWYRADASCPGCYYVTRLPAYRCPGTHLPDVADGDTTASIHYDIRSGLRGVWLRRCGCGSTMPTSLLRAAPVLVSVCPRCTQPLYPESGMRRTVRVALFGGVNVGKTNLVTHVVAALGLDDEVSGRQLTAVDAPTRKACEDFARLVHDGRFPERTPEGTPRALTLRFDGAEPGCVLQLFDAAGSELLRPELNDRHFYLDEAHGLIFVIDPATLPKARRLLDSRGWVTFTRPYRMDDEPLLAFDAVVVRLRESGVLSSAQRLAVVVAKVDRFASLTDIPSATASSEAVRSWLCEYGLSALVRRAEDDFREVRFFWYDGARADAGAAAAAVLWLVRTSSGPRLPGRLPWVPGPGRLPDRTPRSTRHRFLHTKPDASVPGRKRWLPVQRLPSRGRDRSAR